MWGVVTTSPLAHVLDASARSASDTEASPAGASTDEAGSRAVAGKGSLADEAAACEVLTCERACKPMGEHAG